MDLAAISIAIFFSALSLVSLIFSAVLLDRDFAYSSRNGFHVGHCTKMWWGSSMASHPLRHRSFFWSFLSHNPAAVASWPERAYNCTVAVYADSALVMGVPVVHSIVWPFEEILPSQICYLIRAWSVYSRGFASIQPSVLVWSVNSSM